MNRTNQPFDLELTHVRKNTGLINDRIRKGWNSKSLQRWRKKNQRQHYK
jgi:hypothetical protein